MKRSRKSSKPSAPRCMWCDEPSVKLCDTMLRTSGPAIGLDGVTRERTGCIGDETCDARMCERHATRRAKVIVCGTIAPPWEGEPQAPIVDTIDACPYCAAHPKAHLAMSGDAHRERVREHVKAYRRSGGAS